MHKKILDHANETQIKEFVTDFLTMLKARDTELYNDAEEWLYHEVYGCHFNEWLLTEALHFMENEDGTNGGHWNLEETTNVYESKGNKFTDFNEYDWCYVMNMIYSDYYGAVEHNTNTYYNLAMKFLRDKDASKGKAYHYYIAMREN